MGPECVACKLGHFRAVRAGALTLSKDLVAGMGLQDDLPHDLLCLAVCLSHWARVCFGVDGYWSPASLQLRHQNMRHQNNTLGAARFVAHLK